MIVGMQLNNFSWLFMYKKIAFTFLNVFFISCTVMNNPIRPELSKDEQGTFFTAKDGVKIFSYEYVPSTECTCTVFIISGITGINHHAEKDLIEILAGVDNRVVVIHPRGTGYSGGKQGDISNFSDFINDYVEIIRSDRDYQSKQHKIVLFGHSMSTAILLAVADKLEKCDGAILVNPPYLQKKAKGMSPTFFQYIKYACYMVFAKHKPVVNMAGDPAIIENPEDRKESEQRQNAPLLTKYFSMHTMLESKKVMKSMLDYSKKANYPLLLVYGLKDNIVDKKGCDLIFESWKSGSKKYVTIENGSHGKSTVLCAKKVIIDWIETELVN